MKFKSHAQRKAVMAKLMSMKNLGGFRFDPQEDKWTVGRYLKTDKAKIKFVQKFPNSKGAPLYVAQQVESEIKKENESKKGYKSISIGDIQYKNQQAGQHFFSADTMKFFASRTESDAFTKDGTDYAYFVTSEKSGFDDPTRTFTVRRYNKKTHGIDTIGDFNQYKKRGDALAEAKELAKRG